MSVHLSLLAAQTAAWPAVRTLQAHLFALQPCQDILHCTVTARFLALAAISMTAVAAFTQIPTAKA